jgi:hypothetical protein
MSLTIHPIGTVIIADGIYQLDATFQPGTEVILEAAGDFGGGSVAFGYLGGDGEFVGYPDATLTESGGIRCDVPASGRVAVEVDDSTEAEIVIQATRVRAF